MARTTRNGRHMRALVAPLLGILCAALVWNAIAAAFIWRPTGYRNDPVLGRVYRPGLYVYGLEGFSWSTIASDGIRGQDPGPKRPGEKRVLFLGDSFTEAFQVPEADSFAALAAAQLGGPGKASAVNAGRSGASPASYVHLADWYQRRFEPDVTVVQISDQDFSSDLLNSAANFYLQPDGTSFRTVFSPAFRSANGMAQRLAFLTPLLDIPVLRVASDNAAKLLAPVPGGTDVAVASHLTTQDAALVDWTVSSLAARYPRLVLLYIPSVDYFGDPEARSDIETTLLGECRKHGVELVDVREDMVARFRERHELSNGFPNSEPGVGHLNATGHAIVAERLVPAIEEVLR